MSARPYRWGRFPNGRVAHLLAPGRWADPRDTDPVQHTLCQEVFGEAESEVTWDDGTMPHCAMCRRRGEPALRRGDITVEGHDAGVPRALEVAP